MSWQIPVFRAERDAGLANQLRASGRVVYASLVEDAGPSELRLHQLSRRAQAGVRHRVKAAGEGQPDLHYLKTILVTAGVINRNDDAFDTLETWLARHTPEDKPFNYEHVGDDIIGHITGCYPVDLDQKRLDDDISPDDLPSKYHIVTSAVLYKFWEDEELQERMDTILAEIAQGQWYVSMEALFKGFDYLLRGSEGQMRVVARNKDTAFLTKHLRAYGGDGTYEDYRVCRFLRNITFSGKGLVRKPANPDSIIFGDTAAGEIAISSALAGATSYFHWPVRQLEYETSPTTSTPKKHGSQGISEESKTMAADNTDTQVLELRKENTSLREQVERLHASLKEHDSKAVKAQLDTLTGELNSLKSKLEASEQKVQASVEEARTWKTKFEELNQQHAAIARELEDLKKTQAEARRVSLLVGKLGLDEAGATDMARRLTYLTDEDFQVHADYLAEKQAEYRSASNPGSGGGQQSGGAGSGPQTPAKLPPQATDKPAPMAGHPPKVKTLAVETDPAAVHADPKHLDPSNVQPAKEPALSTASTDDGVEKVRASISAWMGDFLGLTDEGDDEK